MVKIHENAPVATDGAYIKHQEALDSTKMCETVAQVGLPPPDLQLVEQARKALKRDLDSDLVESERLYSRYHYDELMETNAPCACWRYLLHCDLNVGQAVELMKQAMIWRKKYRVDEIQPSEMIKDFWLRAPIGIVGKTKTGMDFFYAIGKNFRKPSACMKQTMRDFMAYLLFDWDKRHRYDMSQLVLVFDVSDTTFRNMDLDLSAWFVSIRDFIPTRIYAIYMVGIPFLIRPIIKLILSWLPERYSRIAYCGTYEELVAKNIDESELPREVGGHKPDTWRLAPIDSCWARDFERPDVADIFTEICKACSFNTPQEDLDRLYEMQHEHDRKYEMK